MIKKMRAGLTAVPDTHLFVGSPESAVARPSLTHVLPSTQADACVPQWEATHTEVQPWPDSETFELDW